MFRVLYGAIHTRKKEELKTQDSEFESLYSTWEGSKIDFLL